MTTLHLDPALRRVHPSAFVARGALVWGDVHLGADVSVWFGSVIRGDTEAIRIGPRSNIQDGTVIHADPGFVVQIGQGVTIGHRCVIHGATVGDGAMIGMGSVLLNGCVIGARSIVGAGALVPGGRSYPEEHLILGSPARAIRALRPDEIEGLERSAQHYVDAGEAWRAAGFADGPRSS